MNTERDARKKTLETRIKLYRQMEQLCYEFQQKLQKELDVIEDEESDEFEAHWNARLPELRRFINEQHR